MGKPSGRDEPSRAAVGFGMMVLAPVVVWIFNPEIAIFVLLVEATWAAVALPISAVVARRRRQRLRTAYWQLLANPFNYL